MELLSGIPDYDENNIIRDLREGIDYEKFSEDYGLYREEAREWVEELRQEIGLDITMKGNKFVLSERSEDIGSVGEQLSRPYEYDWSKDELKRRTDFSLSKGSSEENSLLGAVGSWHTKLILDDAVMIGVDETALLSEEELGRSLKDITPSSERYALRLETRDDTYFIEMLGEEEEGLFLTREATLRLGEYGLDDRFGP